MEISVPVRNEDGSLKYDVVMNEKEVQAILQFGLNMALTIGVASEMISPEKVMLLEDDNEELDD